MNNNLRILSLAIGAGILANVLDTSGSIAFVLFSGAGIFCVGYAFLPKD